MKREPIAYLPRAAGRGFRTIALSVNLSIAGAALLAGCGGAGSSPAAPIGGSSTGGQTASSGMGRVVVGVAWPAPSRVIPVSTAAVRIDATDDQSACVIGEGVGCQQTPYYVVNPNASQPYITAKTIKNVTYYFDVQGHYILAPNETSVPPDVLEDSPSTVLSTLLQGLTLNSSQPTFKSVTNGATFLLPDANNQVIIPSLPVRRAITFTVKALSYSTTGGSLNTALNLDVPVATATAQAITLKDPNTPGSLTFTLNATVANLTANISTPADKPAATIVNGEIYLDSTSITSAVLTAVATDSQGRTVVLNYNPASASFNSSRAVTWNAVRPNTDTSGLPVPLTLNPTQGILTSVTRDSSDLSEEASSFLLTGSYTEPNGTGTPPSVTVPVYIRQVTPLYPQSTPVIQSIPATIGASLDIVSAGSRYVLGVSGSVSYVTGEGGAFSSGTKYSRVARSSAFSGIFTLDSSQSAVPLQFTAPAKSGDPGTLSSGGPVTAAIAGALDIVGEQDSNIKVTGSADAVYALTPTSVIRVPFTVIGAGQPNAGKVQAYQAIATPITGLSGAKFIDEDKSGNLYISDGSSVRRYTIPADTYGTGKPIPQVTQFTLLVDGSTLSNLPAKLNPNNETLATGSILDVAVDSAYLYVLATGADGHKRVHVFHSSNGKWLYTITSNALSQSGLDRATAISADSGTLYIAYISDTGQPAFYTFKK